MSSAFLITISEIRSSIGDIPSQLYTTDIGQEGHWYFDGMGALTEDNTGTILVTADLKRFRRAFDGALRPEWFGAKGDFNGTSGTDDTVAIQKCINSIKTGTIIFSGKAYVINQTLVIPSFDANNSAEIVFKGEGKLSSNGFKNQPNDGIVQLVWMGSDTSYTSAIKSDSAQTWCDFSKLMLFNLTNRSDIDGITLNSYRNGSMCEINIFGFRKNLVINGDYYYSTFNKCRFTNAKQINIHTVGLANLATFDNCFITGAESIGFKAENSGDGINIINSTIEGNKGAGLDVSNCRMLNIQGTYIENNGAVGGVLPGAKSQIIFRGYTLFDNAPSVMNISGNYIMTPSDEVHFVRVVVNSNETSGNVSMNIKGNTLPCKVLNNDYTTGVGLTYLIFASENPGKIEIDLQDNKYPYTSINKIYMPCNNRPIDYSSFYASNDDAVNIVRPYWNRAFFDKKSGSRVITNTINSVSPNTVLNGSNRDVPTALDFDFPELSASNGTIRHGRFTNTSGSVIETWHTPTVGLNSVMAIYDYLSGLYSSRGGFGIIDPTSGNSELRIWGGLAAPEGNYAFTKGSIYLYKNTGNTTTGLFVKTTDNTVATGWRLIGVLATTAEALEGIDSTKAISAAALTSVLNRRIVQVANTTDVVNKSFLNTTYNVSDYPIGTIISYYNQGKEYRRETATVWSEKTIVLTS